MKTITITLNKYEIETIEKFKKLYEKMSYELDTMTTEELNEYIKTKNIVATIFTLSYIVSKDANSTN